MKDFKKFPYNYFPTCLGGGRGKEERQISLHMNFFFLKASLIGLFRAELFHCVVSQIIPSNVSFGPKFFKLGKATLALLKGVFIDSSFINNFESNQTALNTNHWWA